MSADRATIRMVANGVEYSFGDLDALVTQTQSYATRVQQEWRNRNAGMASSNDLAWLIRQTDTSAGGYPSHSLSEKHL